MPKQRTGAFTDRTYGFIHTTINSLRDRRLAHMRHGLSTKEIFNAFVKEQDKDTLTRILKISNLNASATSFAVPYARNVEVDTFGSVHFNGSFHIVMDPGRADFLFVAPKYFDKIKNIDKLSVAFSDYLADCCRVGLEWGIVRDVFNALHNQCASPAVVKTVFPAITTLMSVNEFTADQGARLKESKDVMNVPALPLQLRKDALRAATTITKALLLPEKSDLPEDKFHVATNYGMETTAIRWDGTSYTVA